MARKRSGYSAEDIVVLSGLEAVRKNPWMYVGSVGADGVQQLLAELVYNAVDEAAAGACTKIAVMLEGRRARVEDDGRGIPIETHPTEGVPASEVVLTKLHSGSKFSRGSYRFSAGLHGVGLSCVNALSEKLIFETRRAGGGYAQEFRRGEPKGPLKKTGATKRRGTAVEFWPDPEIFKGFKSFDAEACARLLEELSFLTPGVEFALNVGGSGTRLFRHTTGLAGLLSQVNAGARAIGEAIAVKLGGKELELEALLQWTTRTGTAVRSYVNRVRTPLGGAHVAALRAAAVRAVDRMIRETGRAGGLEEAVEAEEALEGLSAVIDLKLAHPNFEGQTKSRLTNAEVLEPIERAASEQLLAYWRAHPERASALAEKVLQVRRARRAAQRAAEKVYFQHVDRGIDERVYKEQFGARSKNWHESAAWITHEELLETHAELCEQKKDAVALDVCCGSGVVGASFKGRVKKVTGLDLTPEMVALAKTRLDEVREGNVYKIPFPDASFDLVCTREVLHLLPYPERPVSEIFRVLKPGGQFIVGQILPYGEDDAPWMFRIFKKKQPLIFNMFQEEDFKQLLAGAGFVDMKMKETAVWESIDVWIDSVETTPLHRHEIRQLYSAAPAEARAIHPFKILPTGEIQDLWRWCVFSVKKPR